MFVIPSWGYNLYGALGLGDTINRGEEANQMGDNLPIVDFGSDFEAVKVRCDSCHCCALSAVGEMKCMVCRLCECDFASYRLAHTHCLPSSLVNVLPLYSG